MSDIAHLLLFSYLAELSVCRHMSTSRSATSIIYAERLASARQIAGMTREKMDALLDRFDAALADASAFRMDLSDAARMDLSDAADRQHAIRLVRGVLNEPTDPEARA